MKTVKNYLAMFALVFFVIGCGDKSEKMTSEEKIAGKDEKTWKAKK